MSSIFFYFNLFFKDLFFCLSYVYVGKHTREWGCFWRPEMSYSLELEPPSVRWALWTGIGSLEDPQTLLTIGPSLQPPPPTLLFGGQNLFTESGAHWFVNFDQQAPWICLSPFPSTRVTVYAAMLAFMLGLGSLNSGLHACWAISPTPCFYFKEQN